jgi:hypothetical protein
MRRMDFLEEGFGFEARADAYLRVVILSGVKRTPNAAKAPCIPVGLDASCKVGGLVSRRKRLGVKLDDLTQV